MDLHIFLTEMNTTPIMHLRLLALSEENFTKADWSKKAGKNLNLRCSFKVFTTVKMLDYDVTSKNLC